MAYKWDPILANTPRHELQRINLAYDMVHEPGEIPRIGCSHGSKMSPFRPKPCPRAPGWPQLAWLAKIRQSWHILHTETRCWVYSAWRHMHTLYIYICICVCVYVHVCYIYIYTGTSTHTHTMAVGNPICCTVASDSCFIHKKSNG